MTPTSHTRRRIRVQSFKFQSGGCRGHIFKGFSLAGLAKILKVWFGLSRLWWTWRRHESTKYCPLPSALKRNMKFLNFAIIVDHFCPGLDPNPDPLSRLDPDPIRIRNIVYHTVECINVLYISPICRNFHTIRV
jgi:hypothetical protein